MEEHRFRGAIVRCRIRDFMTYTDTELKPGPNLNMILGPNGTGKSAVVCAIIIGLAGEVSLTGRGQTASDFVKKGSNYGITEIELYNDEGPNYIVERKIIITDRTKHKIESKSEWKINGETCLKIRVQELMRKLNIKVDNLCQFLPQDSVTQFVKMNSIELLVDTLKAAGDNQLVEDHKTLISKTKEVKDLSSKLSDVRQACSENEANNLRLESDVHLIKQRDELQKKKQDVILKRIYTRYSDSRKKLESVKSQRDEKEKKLKEVLSHCEPFKKAAEIYRNDERRISKSISKSQEQVTSSLGMIRKSYGDIEDLKYAGKQEYDKFRAKQEEENSRGMTIKHNEQKLEGYESRLNEARDIDCTRQIASLAQEHDGIKKEIAKRQTIARDLQDKIQNIKNHLENSKQEQTTIKSIKESKFNLLKTRYPDAHKVLDWLTKNRDRFSGKVYNPIMCEINVKDVRYSKIIEHSINRQDFSAFICDKTEDLTTLTHVAREELKVKVNVIKAPDVSRDAEISSQVPDIKELSSYGVRGFLRDFVEGPPAVIRYLCISNNFHRIPVAEKCTEDQTDALMNRCQKIYINECYYNISTSRYDNHRMTVKDFVRNAVHLQFSLDVKRLQRCQARIAELEEEYKKNYSERASIFTEIEQLNRECSEISKKVLELQNKQSEKDRLERDIKRIRDQLDKMRNERIDIEEERRKFKLSIEKINSKMLAIIEKMSEICSNFVDIQQNHMKSLIKTRLAKYNREIADKKLKEAEQKSVNLREELKSIEGQLKEAFESVVNYKQSAEDKIVGFKNGKLDTELKARFAAIPHEDVQSLKIYEEELGHQIRRIMPGSGGNDIMRDYRRNERELKEKRAQIADLENQIEEIKACRDQIKKNWITKVTDVIKVIDDNYREFMRKLNYGGQVILDYNKDDVDDFSAYGISIMVKYRDNEELIPLSSTRQSGGERSVATMIYMLALQTRTSVPFRCVDEINQGMDKDNERKVFELLVQTADSSSSQYFLVSPKLLHDLPYSEKMKIHIVFNGKKLNLAWNHLDILDKNNNSNTNTNNSVSGTRRSASKRLKAN